MHTNAYSTQFSAMTCKVTRSYGVMVRPSEPTPSGTFDLSVIDKLFKFGDVSLLSVFRNGHESAAKVIREALSKALVPYYPLAGRIKESSDGEVHVACTGEGVWFVAASANYSLDSVHYFNDGVMSSCQELIPTPPNTYGTYAPLVQIQITSFTCKGYVVTLKHSHTICDSLGAAQFLKAVGEFARGFGHPKVAPVWRREAIPTPPWLLRALGGQKVRPPQSPPAIPGNELQQAYIDISLDQIKKLKLEFFKLTGKHCSAFDIATANIWRNRTRAINLEKTTNVHLAFVVNVRPFLDPPLPDGFYGNCLYAMPITTTSGWLVEASNAEIVKLIRNAKVRLPEVFNKWLKSEKMVEDVVDTFSSSVASEYCTLSVSGWGNLGFNEVDYGWGSPVNVLPVQGFDAQPMVIVGSQPAPKKGIRLTTWCVTSHHLPSLLRCYATPSSSRL